ncbi:hypothetical protein KIY87_gp11 [Mycobacterium phage Malec]|uniref:Uncharacterized protein n=1 Tax=Mycobacterium phage Malec TaxID=2500574 RepID=A0A3T0ILE0_9CAUD|nr:hypothetical protein KIY87_gp11 [Mycobacterium phage Malec]AZV00884.1 hypothetical protein SEA_MALEC_90 [Mycobacterium phage Malec]
MIMEPPNGQYRKAFDPELHRFAAKTADGVPIYQGMRVFTNNLDRGVVDLSRAEFEWHAGEGIYHLWFDVLVDTNYRGERVSQRDMQSDDRVTTRFQGEAA